MRKILLFISIILFTSCLPNNRSYQLLIIKGKTNISDSVQLYDGKRLVGTFKLDYDADPVSTLILEDIE
jgi:hypothetical protein